MTMEVSGYVRGIPTYEDLNGNTYGMLCETKEKLITDDSGVALDFKLEELRKQIKNSGGGNTDASTLEGHNAAYFATAESVTNITNGTTKVGNAKTLDGHEAEYFFPKEGGRIRANSNEPLEIENTRSPYRGYITFFGTSGKSGSLGFSSKDEPTYVDSAGIKAYELLHTGNMANHVLPKSGGKLSTSVSSPLTLESTTTDSTNIVFNGASGTLGHIGFVGANTPAVWNSDSVTWYNLLHTGNSAKVVVSQTAPSDTTALWVW